MTMDHTLFPISFVVFLAWLCYFLLKRHYQWKIQRIAKLPPGSMGWPYMGETLQLYSRSPNEFFSHRQKKYGEIFKTHLLGHPCVMLASPMAARFVLVTQAHLFKPTYPKSKEQMIGPSALFFHQGDYHTRLRKLVLRSLSPQALTNLIPSIEAISATALRSWSGRGHVLNTFHEMKKFSFDVGILIIFSELEMNYKDQLKRNYFMLDKGYNSFPAAIWGTPYHDAIRARKRLSEVVRQIILERRQKKLAHSDLLDRLMNPMDGREQPLTQDQIADNIVGVLFAAQDTTASALTWIMKFLLDYPRVLESVRKEQRTIHDANKGGTLPLTWMQIRNNMPFTHMVIFESLRMASVINFTFREAVVDVEYQGYLIPKGWKVMPLFRSIHHNPEFFQNPQRFDPSRFQVLSSKPNNFLPFGSGVHSCPGNELAKIEMLILIHHLVTSYRWELEGCQEGVEYDPFPVPKHGLPIKLWMVDHSTDSFNSSQSNMGRSSK